MTPGPGEPFHTLIGTIPKDLPFVIFGTATSDVSCISCIGQDEFQSGKLAGRLMEMLVARTGTIAVVRILPLDDHIENRAKGFESYFKSNKAHKLSSYRIEGNSDFTGFRDLFNRMRSDHQNLKGIFVTNVNTHKFAAAIEESQLEGTVHLVGYDLIEENVHYLKEEVIDFLISQRPEIQAYQGIHALYRHVVLNEPCKERMLMPIDVVAKENIDFYKDFRESF